MRALVMIVAILAIAVNAVATTYVVDINGGGRFTSINTAIQSASLGDTIKVWPGTYNEQVVLNRSVVLMGSGYENTIIAGDLSPAVSMNAGEMLWFRITSATGIGINLSGGTLSNCVIMGCAGDGVLCSTAPGIIRNCVMVYNGEYGIYSSVPSPYPSVYNCISYNNVYTTGFQGGLVISYSDGGSCCGTGGTGMINSNPNFVSSSDFHLNLGSPCIDTGNPSLSDPDGTQSDIGYFGGPDCPIYPVVTLIRITPNDSSTVNVQASARANY